MGRRAHRPDLAGRRQVEALAGYGIPEAEIAGVVGIDPKTLRKHYRHELDHGHTKANARVAENLYRKATGEGREAVTAAIFWLKTRAGWKETTSTRSVAGTANPSRSEMPPPSRSPGRSCLLLSTAAFSDTGGHVGNLLADRR